MLAGFGLAEFDLAFGVAFVAVAAVFAGVVAFAAGFLVDLDSGLAVLQDSAAVAAAFSKYCEQS